MSFSSATRRGRSKKSVMSRRRGFFFKRVENKNRKKRRKNSLRGNSTTPPLPLISYSRALFDGIEALCLGSPRRFETRLLICLLVVCVEERKGDDGLTFRGSGSGGRRRRRRRRRTHMAEKTEQTQRASSRRSTSRTIHAVRRKDVDP